MSFDAYGVTQKETKAKTDVDFAALDQYVIETAGLQERETLVGIVSVIADLGEQDLPDAETKFTGTPEEEAEIIAQQPDTYFKNGIDQDTKKPVRLKCWPQKPQQCVAIAVDFPQIMLDKGSFFGDSKPAPLRIWMGGQFYKQTQGMTVARPTPLKVVNLDKTRATRKWSLAQNSLLYKMAVGAKIINAGDVFLPNQIDQLLGKALQFTAQIYMKPSGDKSYYTEYIQYAAGVGRGMTVPELPYEPLLVQFNKPNTEDAIRGLRAHVVNTMKAANNYASSLIKTEIEQYRGKPAGDKQAAPQAAPAQTQAPAPSTNFDQFDDDIPF